MAIYNQIQEKSLNRLLQQRLTMTGEAPAPALVPEVSASLVLESDRPEWKRWKPETLFSGQTTVTAVAAEYASVWIPPATGLVIVITSLTVTTTPRVGVGWRATQPSYTLPSISNSYPTDNSFGSVPSAPQLIAGTSVALPAFDNAGSALFASLHTLDRISTLENPLVLWPGRSGVLVRDSAVNQTLRVQVTGYYRTLLPNEVG